jgi:hypothetical protein
MLAPSYYLLCFLFNKIGEEDRTGSAWKQERAEGRGDGETGGEMHAHMNKCINNFLKIRKENNNEKDMSPQNKSSNLGERKRQSPGGKRW